MIAIHLFPKNIKTPIILPYQWLNLTFNAIRSNLSTTSDSSSDSDSDSDNPKHSTKNYKKINYLDGAKMIHKKREIEKQLTKTAQFLTLTSGENKEKILSGLLDTISKIQEEDTNSLVKSNKNQNKVGKENKMKYVKQQSKEKHIENVGKEKDRRYDPFTVRMQQGQKRRTKYNDHKFETKVDVPGKPSIIRMLKKQKEKTKVELKEASLIRTLQNEQKMLKNVYDKVGPRYDQSDLPSKSYIQKKQTAKTMYIDKFEMKERYSPELEGQSIIQMLKDKKEKTKELFPIKTLHSQKYQQWKKRNIKEDTIDIQWDKEYTKFTKIFDNEFLDSADVPEFKIWNLCEEKELQSIVTRYPENALQEMIEWTNQGKLWKFPIDNEQGMEKEHNVHFSKHVFLERHLSPWCPAKGPIRHFMELVCIGLSKNPYMTFEEKYDHIMWYKDYFKDKQDLLQKLGLTTV